MSRHLKFVALAITILLVVCLLGVKWLNTSAQPLVHHLPLSPNLIDANSVEGRALLSATTFRVDYGQLSPYYVAQSRSAFCGVASSVIVINALLHPHPLLSQTTLFTPKVSAVISIETVTLNGLTLEQLAGILRALGLTVTVVHASQTNLKSFLSAARSALGESSEFLITNYDRQMLHQQGAGHISPVAAYNADTNRFLILDVAANKYPPTWVSTNELWSAMNTIDSSSGKSRGFLLVSAGGT